MGSEFNFIFTKKTINKNVINYLDGKLIDESEKEWFYKVVILIRYVCV